MEQGQEKCRHMEILHKVFVVSKQNWFIPKYNRLILAFFSLWWFRLNCNADGVGSWHVIGDPNIMNVKLEC